MSVGPCTTHDRHHLVQEPRRSSRAVRYDDTGSGVLATLSGHVVGAAAFGGPLGAPGTDGGARQLTVEVSAAWRRLGIGTELLARAVRQAVDAGYDEVLLVGPADDEGFVPMVCGAGLRARLKASDGLLHARILLPRAAA